jgi:predicted nuclease with TOPRIM domain
MTQDARSRGGGYGRYPPKRPDEHEVNRQSSILHRENLKLRTENLKLRTEYQKLHEYTVQLRDEYMKLQTKRKSKQDHERELRATVRAMQGATEYGVPAEELFAGTEEEEEEYIEEDDLFVIRDDVLDVYAEPSVPLRQKKLPSV